MPRRKAKPKAELTDLVGAMQVLLEWQGQLVGAVLRELADRAKPPPPGRPGGRSRKRATGPERI